MTKTAAKKARQAEASRSTAKKALNGAFGKELAEAATKPQATKEKPVEGQQAAPWGIFVDNQGVPYLRVEETKKGARYLISTGAAVEVVELDAQTIQGRALEQVQASIFEAAKILANPLTDGVIISERSKTYLEKILSDKGLEAQEEEKVMATKKAKAAKSTSATKTAAHAKSGSTRSAESLVQFKKAPKDGELPKQASIIVELAKAAGKLTIAELQKKMSSKIESKQSMAALWGFYRGRLIKEGFIVVAPAAV